MVTAGDDDVSLSCIRSDAHPFIGIELDRAELLHQRLIFRYRNLFIVHHPFAARENGVEAPVNEHTKPGILKPLQTLGGNLFHHVHFY